MGSHDWSFGFRAFRTVGGSWVVNIGVSIRIGLVLTGFQETFPTYSYPRTSKKSSREMPLVGSLDPSLICKSLLHMQTPRNPGIRCSNSGPEAGLAPQ